MQQTHKFLWRQRTTFANRHDLDGTRFPHRVLAPPAGPHKPVEEAAKNCSVVVLRPGRAIGELCESGLNPLGIEVWKSPGA
ncbi:hypothetical protein ACFL59_10275 [Planctomycetota bacterium]